MVEIININYKNMIKGGVNKAIWVNEERHEKLKIIAKVNHQTMNEWVSWVIDKGYEVIESDLKNRVDRRIFERDRQLEKETD